MDYFEKSSKLYASKYRQRNSKHARGANIATLYARFRFPQVFNVEMDGILVNLIVSTVSFLKFKKITKFRHFRGNSKNSLLC